MVDWYSGSVLIKYFWIKVINQSFENWIVHPKIFSFNFENLRIKKGMRDMASLITSTSTSNYRKFLQSHNQFYKSCYNLTKVLTINNINIKLQKVLTITKQTRQIYLHPSSRI